MPIESLKPTSRSMRWKSKVDEAAIALLALRQPMADDLREVVAALKIAHVLERIADYAANVAKRISALSQAPQIEPMNSIPGWAGWSAG